MYTKICSLVHPSAFVVNRIYPSTSLSSAACVNTPNSFSLAPLGHAPIGICPRQHTLFLSLTQKKKTHLNIPLPHLDKPRPLHPPPLQLLLNHPKTDPHPASALGKDLAPLSHCPESQPPIPYSQAAATKKKQQGQKEKKKKKLTSRLLPNTPIITPHHRRRLITLQPPARLEMLVRARKHGVPVGHAPEEPARVDVVEVVVGEDPGLVDVFHFAASVSVRVVWLGQGGKGADKVRLAGTKEGSTGVMSVATTLVVGNSVEKSLRGVRGVAGESGGGCRTLPRCLWGVSGGGGSDGKGGGGVLPVPVPRSSAFYGLGGW